MSVLVHTWLRRRHSAGFEYEQIFQQHEYTFTYCNIDICNLQKPHVNHTVAITNIELFSLHHFLKGNLEKLLRKQSTLQQHSKLWPNQIVIVTPLLFIQLVQESGQFGRLWCMFWKGNHGNSMPTTHDTGHSNLHSKEIPTKMLILRHHKTLLHYLQITSRIYRVHLSLQKETK